MTENQSYAKYSWVPVFIPPKEMLSIFEGFSSLYLKRELIIDEKTVSLSNKESRLLKLFMKTEGEVLAHERIYTYLWDFDEEPSDTALRTYIKNLRKIIGKERIVSIKKQGYKFITEK